MSSKELDRAVQAFQEEFPPGTSPVFSPAQRKEPTTRLGRLRKRLRRLRFAAEKRAGIGWGTYSYDWREASWPPVFIGPIVAFASREKGWFAWLLSWRNAYGISFNVLGRAGYVFLLDPDRKYLCRKLVP